MGFLRGVRGGGKTSQLNLTLVDHRPRRPDAQVDVVGEEGYQHVLSRLGGTRDERGVANRRHPAILVPEPDNPRDENAIAVYLQDGDASITKVGYLRAADALAYQPLYRLIAPAVIRCEARLKGGWDRGGRDVGKIGVVVRLGKPIETMAEEIADRYPLRTDHAWRGQTVVFTGESWCGVMGLRLEKPTREFLAARARCRVATRMTKDVQLCVESMPDDDSATHRKAEQWGVPRVAEPEFWRTVGLHVTVLGPP
jgi:hypothetical protein